MSRRAINKRREDERLANPPPPPPPPIDKDELIARQAYEILKLNEQIDELKVALAHRPMRPPTEKELQEAVKHNMKVFAFGTGEPQEVFPREGKKPDA
jgi:hypothetical protein